jgi:acyl carrier protein
VRRSTARLKRTAIVIEPFDTVRSLLIGHLGVDAASIKPDAKLNEDLGCDSLDAIELAQALEDEFGVLIPDGELSDAATVADMVALVQRQLAARPKAEQEGA